MGNDITYGGITRSKAENLNGYYASKGGQLTFEMIGDAFKAIERMDEMGRQQEEEFYKRLRPFQHLCINDTVAYIAAYRIIRSSVYIEAALHPKNYEEYMAILKDRGIEI